LCQRALTRLAQLGKTLQLDIQLREASLALGNPRGLLEPTLTRHMVHYHDRAKREQQANH
jgi:hypothetical protein